jgi:hypothetical protein
MNGGTRTVEAAREKTNQENTLCLLPLRHYESRRWWDGGNRPHPALHHFALKRTIGSVAGILSAFLGSAASETQPIPFLI